jgi:hypothetical protein
MRITLPYSERTNAHGGPASVTKREPIAMLDATTSTVIVWPSWASKLGVKARFEAAS